MPERSLIARIGGDEFAVYLHGVVSANQIALLCADLRDGAHMIRMGEEHITISIGAVTARRMDDYDTLYRLADHQMYEAKRNEKDRFCQNWRGPAEESPEPA